MTEHPAVTQLDALAGDLLDQARTTSAKRTARTLVTGSSLRATLIALAEGSELAEHDAPAAATLQVVTGRVQLYTSEHEQTVENGQLAVIPPLRHGLKALADSVVLLTVALR
ncbi:Cupin domain protein [Lentzea fradiae]|uniref:Cupin domain protein n=1 Tax=Lentzea fradiae TaxID=200378 RepID=A0A1G8DE52_9PSEU|nr:cupin domain-containing protein [Lentzea fradiae]SDH55719.1 Cupin domain protein [Lentzea fradiae]